MRTPIHKSKSMSSREAAPSEIPNGVPASRKDVAKPMK
jgi:hypothetical protein